MNTSWIEDVDKGALVITVNQRLSRHLMHVWRQQRVHAGAQIRETATIVPLTSWAQGLHKEALARGICDVTLMSTLASQRLWGSVIAQSEHGEHLLDVQATASNVQKAWALQQQWQVELTAKNLASNDQLAFQQWQKTYLKRCHKNAQIDDAVLLSHVVEWLSTRSSQLALPDKILLAGFLTQTTQQQQLFSALEKLGVQVETIKLERSAQLARVEAADDDQLLHTIAREIRQCVEASPDAAYGLVVPDLQQKRAQVMRAFDAVFFPSFTPDQISLIGRPYETSLGVSLAEQAPIRSALLLLKLLVSGIDNHELSAILLSPYLSRSDKDLAYRERVDRRCRERRIRHAGLSVLLTLLPDTLGLRKALLKVSKKRLPKQSSCAQWASWFATALGDAGWPGKSLNSEEFQIVQAWHGCLDNLQKLDDDEKLSPAQALTLLKQLATETLFQLETPSMPVQIMGRLESHGIEFSKLWVTGMDAELWPAVSSPSPFLSIQAQQKAGVPDASATARLGFAQAEFSMWQQSAKELFACHVASRDGQPVSPASVAAHLPLAEINTVPIDVYATMRTVQCSGELEWLDDPNGPSLTDGETVKGGARLLENQARCPFKAFALHRLHIKPLEEAGIGIDPRQAGTLLHDSLEYFWDQTKTQAALLAMSESHLAEAIDESIAHAIQKMSLDKKLQDIQKRYLRSLLTDWFNQCEKPRAPFEVLEVESERELELGGIKMNLKVDRIDKLEGGQKVILDYKTGQGSSISSWAEDRIESPQLPLYSSTDDSIDGISFAQVFPHKHRFIGLTTEEGMLPAVKTGISKSDAITDWSGWREHWQTALQNIALEIKQGVATITPAKNACQFCELTSLCRIDSTRVQSDDEVSDADATNNSGSRS